MLINKKYIEKIEDEKFSIIIPTWNNAAYLKVLIESIRKNSNFKHQIILHINDGNDGTLDWALQQPDISFTHSKVNVGICKAVNLAAAMAHTQYIAYINDDMYVCPKWDEHLWNEIEAIGHPYFFLSGTMIEFFDTQNPCVVFADYGHDLADFNEEKIGSEYQQPFKKDWSGSTWPPNVVHKDVWNMVGGYSVEFSPGMYSDPDFSMKLWQLGVRHFKGVGASRVYHFGSKSVSRIKKNKGKDTFIKKWGISSRFFSKHYLKLGADFSGILTDQKLSFAQKLVNYLKRLKYFG
jgi:glycosyltransferase involved in cell wall biosynthesis